MLRNIFVLSVLIFSNATIGSGALAGEEIAREGVVDSGDRYHHAIEEAGKELSGQANTMAEPDGWGVSAVLSIIALGLAVVLMVWLTRRLRRQNWTGGAGTTMRIVDRMPLGRQSTLFIVEIESRRYWLAEHSQGVSMLGECPPPIPEPPHANAP